MTKPLGYRQSAKEQVFCLFVLALPYYQSLFLAGISGLVTFLLLTVLLMFVVAHSPTIYQTIRTYLRTFPSWWISQVLDARENWIAAPSFFASFEPSLAPSFQRPPPLFS